MKKILIAIDSSKGAMKAVDHVGQQFGGMSDVHITLFHVLTKLPPQFWDDGHLLTGDEKDAREKVVRRWMENQGIAIEPFFKRAIEQLTNRGISRQQIETKTVSESESVPEGILAEAKEGGYQMLAIGRHSYSRAERILIGSVTSKIVNLGAGIPVCVVE